MNIDDLREAKKIMDSLKIKFFICFGTLLGAYRDKDFLKGDIDIDFGVFDQKDKRDELRDEFVKRGFTVRLANPKWGGPCLTVQRKTIIDIHFFIKKNSHWRCYLKKDKECMKFPDTFNKLEKIKFKGMSFLAPSPIPDFLEYCYGAWEDKENRVQSKAYIQSK